MLAVGGGGMLTLGLGISEPAPCRGFLLPPFLCSLSRFSPSIVCFLGWTRFSPEPPYFSSNSRVESYLVASFSFCIVLARSVWWSLRRDSSVSMRKLK